ncbi:hypothetical protein WJX81_005873 [Elliptochloris bilobata]|uniref:Peptidase S54 rhomboid domain-containing protein n=1 Tax=Elliptochloris bilobata TaxID=381761 RepID=A0AAW1SIC0_9CHLO
MERERYYFGKVLGASGLCFALQVVADAEEGGEVALTLAPSVRLPRRYLPWISMAVSQVLVPRASLAGHLCGIAAGVLYSYAAAGVECALAWLSSGWPGPTGQARQQAAQQRFHGGGRLDGRPIGRAAERRGRRTGRGHAWAVHLALLAAGFALDIGHAQLEARRRSRWQWRMLPHSY